MSKKNKRPADVSASTPIARPAASDFNPDYSDVKKDLKTIGILAGTFIAILIALSFFLN